MLPRGSLFRGHSCAVSCAWEGLAPTAEAPHSVRLVLSASLGLPAIGGLCHGRIPQPKPASACSLCGKGFLHAGPQAVNADRRESHRPSFAQSSMASNWSARASNMVLMSSRMCLVDGPVGPSCSSEPMFFSAALSAASKDELVCSSLCWARPGHTGPVFSGLGGGTGRGPSRGASFGPENAS